MLYGTSDSEPQTDYVVAQLSQELYNSNLLLLLIQVSFLINGNCIKNNPIQLSMLDAITLINANICDDSFIHLLIYLVIASVSIVYIFSLKFIRI